MLAIATLLNFLVVFSTGCNTIVCIYVRIIDHHTLSSGEAHEFLILLALHDVCEGREALHMSPSGAVLFDLKHKHVQARLHTDKWECGCIYKHTLSMTEGKCSTCKTAREEPEVALLQLMNWNDDSCGCTRLRSTTDTLDIA